MIPHNDTPTINSLLTAIEAVLNVGNFKNAAQIIFREAKKVIGATSGYIALLTESGEENEVLFLDAGGLPCTVDPSLPMPIRGLREECYKTKKPIYHNNFMQSSYVKYMPAGHVILNNVMFSPLLIEGKAVGVMGLANKPVDFTNQDTEFAALFGHYAAIALNNSRTIDKLRTTVENLELSLSRVKTLEGLLPICAACKKIRDSDGKWHNVDTYISNRTDATFTHGYCPDCYKKAMDSLDLSK
jgi:GAF domain-containing protein